MVFSKSKKYFDEYEKYILPVIHFKQPIIERASGVYVYDMDGNEILDLNGGQFCTIFGHSNPEIKKKFDEINTTIQHTNTATLTTQVLKAMKKVHDIMPEMNAKTIFLATGSESVEFAIRYAKHITNKTGLVCFDIGYHGLTLGAQSITYSGVHARPLVSNTHSIPTPKGGERPEELENILKKFRDICENNSIAAFIVEPVVSVGGMYVQDTLFFSKIKEICREFNVLLIFDECQTCLGRTGEWFGYQTIDVVPDIVVAAKGLGLGYPVGMVSISDEYVTNYPSIVHYSSHQNDPFSAEVISLGIDYIQENDILEKVNAKGEYFMQKLEELRRETHLLGQPRGVGLMLACDLEIEGVTDYRKISEEFIDYLLENYHLMIQATNGGKTLRFLPSYLITESEIDKTVGSLKNGIETFFDKKTIKRSK